MFKPCLQNATLSVKQKIYVAYYAAKIYLSKGNHNFEQDQKLTQSFQRAPRNQPAAASRPPGLSSRPRGSSAGSRQMQPEEGKQKMKRNVSYRQCKRQACLHESASNTPTSTKNMAIILYVMLLSCADLVGTATFKPEAITLAPICLKRYVRDCSNCVFKFACQTCSSLPQQRRQPLHRRAATSDNPYVDTTLHWIFSRNAISYPVRLDTHNVSCVRCRV